MGISLNPLHFRSSTKKVDTADPLQDYCRDLGRRGAKQTLRAQNTPQCAHQTHICRGGRQWLWISSSCTLRGCPRTASCWLLGTQAISERLWYRAPCRMR